MQRSWFLAGVLSLSFFLYTPATAQEQHKAGMPKHAHESGKKPSKTALRPPEGAQVKILSPSAGQQFTGDEIPLRYTLVKGKKGSHVHAYVDGELMGMFGHPERGTLTGIQPGNHTLELRVVAIDHTTELDATDKVQFVVK